MKRLTLLVAAAVVAACGKTPDGALSVRVRVAPALEADCLELVVSAGGQARKSLLFPRTAGKAEWLFGVQRGDELPATVTFQARGLLGRCDDVASLKLNARSVEVEASFPRQGVQEVAPLQLDPPGATLDADRDGYAARAQGGADCDDTSASTSPGAAQRCDGLEDTDCDGLGGCDDPDCASSATCASPPDRLALAGVPASALRGRCVGPVTVELRDGLGRRAAVRPTTVRLSSSGAGLGVFTDPDCTDATDRVTVPFLQDGARVYVRGDVAGLAVLTVTGERLAPSSVELPVAPWQPVVLAFTSPPRALTAGRCAMNEMTVELRDEQGRPTTASTALAVALAATPNDAEGNFFTAADCAASSASATVPLPAGASSATFRVRSRRATSAGAPLRVTAQVDVGAATPLVATQDVTVGPALATRLAFLTMPLAISAGAPCSATPSDVRLRVEVQDEFGNRAPAPRTTTLTIGGVAGVTFYDAAQGDCSAPVASVPLLVGAAQVDFFLKGATAAQGLVTVSDSTGGLAEAVQPLVVTGGAATKVVWDPNPRTAVSSQCSPAPLVLGAYDAASSPAAFGTPQAVALSALPAVAGLSFFTAAGCPPGALVAGPVTFPAGATQLPLYFRGPTAVAAFAVRASPLDAAISGGDVPGNAIVAGAPASLRFSPTAVSTPAGACAGPVTVGLFDAANNPAFFSADVDLSFTAESGSVTWGSTAASCAGTTPIPLGRQTSAAVYFSGTVARSYTLTATTSAMVSSSNTAALTVTPAAAASLARLEPAQAAQTLTAGTCLRVSLALRDAFGNDVPVGATAPLSFSALPMGVTLHADQPSCLAKSNPVTGFTLSASDVGRVFFVRAERPLSAAPVTATLLGRSTSLSLTVVPAATASLTLVGLPATRQAGACLSPVTLVRRDAFGNDVTNGPALTATVSGAGLRLYASSGCVGSLGGSASVAFAENGATSASFSVDGLTAGTFPVQAAVGAITDTKNLTVDVGPASTLAVTTLGGPISAGACVDLTVQVRDTYGNPVTGTVNITLNAPLSSGLTLFPQAACGGTPSTMTVSRSTSGLSTAAFSVRGSSVTPSATVTATAPALASTTVTYAVGSGAATKVVIAETPAPVVAGACVSATAVVQDAFDNPVSGARTITLSASPTVGVTLYAGGACGGGPVTQVSTGGASSAAFSARVTRALPAQGLTVASTGLTPATKSWLVTPGMANKLVITTPGGNVSAGQCVDVTAEVRDTFDNPVTGTRDVTLALSPTTGVTVFPQASCQGTPPATRSTGGTATATLSFRAVTTLPMLQASVTASGLMTGTQAYAVVPGAPAKLVWKTAPPSTLTRFTCSAAATVQLRDAQDNVSPAATPTTVSLASSASGAGVSFFADSMCATTASSVAIAAGASEANVYLVATGAGTTNVTGTSGALTATPAAAVTAVGVTTDKLVVSSASPNVEPGACVAVTVARQTAANAPISLGSSAFSLSSSDPAVGLFTAADCSGVASATVSGAIPPGSGSTTVYARGRSVPAPLMVTLTATDPNAVLTAGTTTVSAHPLVRRGTCALADGESTRRCVLAPAIPGHDISRSFLLFSSSGDNTTPVDGNVHCRLDATMTDTAVACARGGSSGPVVVDYQVVSWGRGFANGGVSVRHLSGVFASGATILDVAVGPALTSLGSSFLLFSSSSASGALNGEAHFPTARLLDASTVRLQRATTTSALTYSLQVVEFAGATVQRNRLTSGTGTSFTVSGLMDLLRLRSFILYSARMDAGPNDDHYICKRRLRARHDSTTQLSFTRGAGGGGAGSNCSNANLAELAWERVTLPECGGGPCSTVQHPAEITLTDGDASGTVSFATAVETHRAVVLFAGQGPGGQSAGEGNYDGSNSSTGDNTGALHGRATFTNSTTVRVDRALDEDKAVFSPQVIQFEP
jgi:hypothetical protein